MSPPAGASCIRRQVAVRGLVQGVGFRPFVYRTAKSLRLGGVVFNTSSGVTIEVEGIESDVDKFLRLIRTEAPALARIEDVQISDLPPRAEGDFTIGASVATESDILPVCPEVATCAECTSEVADADNRRFGYPFTNCINCGPRYTITRAVPYDRPFTTMAHFVMCSACRAEYDDPSNRRFHAQPNGCPACGPGLAILEQCSAAVPEQFLGTQSLEIIRRVRDLIRAGGIVAIRGVGGFHLACDATNSDAVSKLRSRKKRSDKPFAIMSASIEDVRTFCAVSEADARLLLSNERPIVILPRLPEAKIAPSVAPGNSTLGVMLPYTPLHALLFTSEDNEPPNVRALVMTSGNLSDEPIVTSNEEAIVRLRGIADAFLFHNRDIHVRVDDSVARTFQGSSMLLRRSRGYVPRPIDLGMPAEEILAFGADLKNTFCLTKGQSAVVSQHIGDLECYETVQFFQETLERLKRLFHIEPRAIAHDLHPGYISSRLARGVAALPKIAIQHHHAHLASCMIENGIHGNAIGVICDGTGYGTDGQVWGGEFLIGDFSGFNRRAHFAYVSLTGGDAAIRHPWRSALGYIHTLFGSKSLPSYLPFFEGVSEREVSLVAAMLEKNINTVRTSSAGRLFDAVASLIGVRHEVTFEGQAAIELEMMIEDGVDERYGFEITENQPAEVDFRQMIAEILRDVAQGMRPERISARFHNTVAAAILAVCERLRREEHLSRVCISGGTFQNLQLLHKIVPQLRRVGFDVFLHSKVPTNDGGISLGQAVIANHILKKAS